MNTFKYRPEVDGLRALAVLPVILFHAGLEAFSGGFVGVDVFFVVSGYLITTIIITELSEDRFSLVHFFERRARRLMPAMFVLLTVCVPLAWIWLSPNDFIWFGYSMASVMLFISNIFFFVNESNYFSPISEFKPLLHTWSLAIEEQYYLLFPAFLMLAWRIGIKLILIILAVIFLISFGLAIWAVDNAPVAGYYLLPARGWELLVGVFTAFYLRHHAVSQSHTVNQAISLLGLGMVIYSMVAFGPSTPWPSSYALVTTVGTSLVILCAVPNTLVYNLLSAKPVVFIGLISYSAYLWHQPIYALVRHALFLEDFSNLMATALCVLSLVIAWVSWRFVEKPCRDKSIVSRKAIFSISIAGILVFAGLGMLISSIDGYSSKKYTNINQKLRSMGVSDFDHINARLAGESWGLLRDLTSNPNYFIDKNAEDKSHFAGMNSGEVKRLLLVGNSFSKDIFNVLSHSDEVRERFEIARYGIQLHDIDAEFYTTTSYKNADVLMLAAWLFHDDFDSLYDFAVRVSDDGKKLYIVEQPILMPRVGLLTLADNIVLSRLESKTLTLDELREEVDAAYTKFFTEHKYLDRERERMDQIDEIVSRIQRDLPDVSILNEMDFKCQNNYCPGLTEEGKKIYYDHVHKSEAGAKFFGERLSETKFYAELLDGVARGSGNSREN